MGLKLHYRQLLEGIVKFNILFFFVMMAMIYFKYASFEEYYSILGNQLFLIFFTIVFSRCYLKLHNKTIDAMAVTRQSLYIGLVGTVIFTYFHGVYIGDFPFNAHLLLLLVLSLTFGAIYWHLVISLQDLPIVFNNIIKFLDTEFTYKDFINVVLMLNAAFFVILAMVVMIGPENDRSIVESIFVIIYFQAAFFIFHFVVAKIVDMVWNKKNTKFSNVSMLGMTIGSICYIAKINIIDKSLLNLFYFSPNKGPTPLLAVLTLFLFWSFFALLFHFEVKYPLKGRRLKKAK